MPIWAARGRMILTLTPNPTIDRVLFVPGLCTGTIVRAEREVVTPSGKGVGASLVISELGGQTVALGLVAGRNGSLLADLLGQQDISTDLVSGYGETKPVLGW